MPVPEERLYRPDRINLWFAVSSVLMAASILWMIWVDYRRPWQDFQQNYYVGKAAVAHLEYLDATREERIKERAEAQARFDQQQEVLNLTEGSRLAQVRGEWADAQLKFKLANGPWSAASQVLDVTKDAYERSLNIHGAEHPATKAAHEQLRGEEEEVERLRKDKELWEDAKKNLESEIKKIEEPVRSAEKKLRELEQIAAAALQKDQQYRGVLTDQGLLGGLPVVSSFINAPLMDFLSPKNTPGRFQVNQLVLPKVRQQLNYLETYTTDRCTTCHVGIADPEFSMDRLAHKLEEALPGINEALQRMGEPPLDPPTPPVPAGEAGSPLIAGRVTEHWARLSHAQQKEYFEALLARVNKYFKLAGRRTIDLGQPLLAHPDLNLYVTVDSPHPMAQMGCSVCHEGNPQETDFVLAGHTPPTHEIEKEWAEKYYVTAAGVPAITFAWMAHFWDRPMRLPQNTEAGCAKCHSHVADVSRFEGAPVGGQINFGRHLFTNVGCVNCHKMDDIPDSEARRVGPDLSFIAAKLKPEFVERWAFFPQMFRPSTKMPHLFQQENSLAESQNQFDSDPVLRTETEVAAITSYLFTVSKPWKPVEKPAAVQGDAERGRQLFKQVGCQACHANLSENGEGWITKDLMQRLKLDAETATFRFKGMTYEERVRYALDHFATDADSFFDPEKTAFRPEDSYHLPTYTRVGPELSGVGSKVSLEWLYSWISDPVHYSVTTKMPNMRLAPDEAADIATYLFTLKNERFEQKRFEMNEARRAMADELMFTLLAAQRSERRARGVLKDEGGELTEMLTGMLAPAVDRENEKNGRAKAYDLVQGLSLNDKKQVYLGNKMISHYGCYACHTIPGFEETTEPGTNLTTWAQKPITQLDFAFYDDAFHHLRETKEDIFGHLYPQAADGLNYWSPGDNPKEEITHTHAAFAKHKLLNPRIWDREKIKKPYDKLKMPNFYFTEHEADALTTYLLSRVAPRVDGSLKIDYQSDAAGPIAEGRILARELNCVGCHQIEENTPVIQQYFRRETGGKLVFDQTNAPPLLWGEGAKVQHPWFHRFLQQVEPLRPWLTIRMPSFNLTGAQATTLVEYFAALSQHDAKWLNKAVGSISEYQKQEAKKSAPESATAAPVVAAPVAAAGAAEAGSVQPGFDWFRQDLLRRTAGLLRRWAVDRRLLRPADADMLKLAPEGQSEAHAKLFERADFMARLNSVDYPFVEPSRPVSAPQRLEKGQQFFNDMGCLKCHVFGNMLPGPAESTDEFVQVYRLDSVRGEGDKAVAVLNGVPHAVGSEIDGHKLVSASTTFYESGDTETKAFFEGPKEGGGNEKIMLQAASAPNLSLTHQRLRRGWVYEWMLYPQWIQPGTKMPQNFPGGESPFQDDPKYPGSGADHINLLVDYLFDAGVTGMRSPQPKLNAPAESEEFDEGGGKAEEFEE